MNIWRVVLFDMFAVSTGFPSINLKPPSMKKAQIRFVQQQLKKRGFNAGPADGVAGPITMTALDATGLVPEHWDDKRKLTGFVQSIIKEQDIDVGDIDGYWGPQTQFGYDTLLHFLKNGQIVQNWRPEEIQKPATFQNWPLQTPEDELVKYFGNPGENQTRLALPYPHRLSWDTTSRVNSFLCHEKVHDSLQRVLTRVLEHYGLQEIRKLRLDLWGGCLNVRAMRGGSRYSAHAWGIAVDYDPERNRLQWGRDKATFSKPAYDMWWRCWEEEGWVSLGRFRNFDWMHIQACRIC